MGVCRKTHSPGVTPDPSLIAIACTLARVGDVILSEKRTLQKLCFVAFFSELAAEYQSIAAVFGFAFAWPAASE